MVTAVNQPIVWSEIDHRFQAGPNGELQVATNIDAIKSSIYNILGTRKGSRVMLPSFAETFGDMLFEPINGHLSSYLSTQLKDTIEAWDDRVTIVESDFEQSSDLNQVKITVKFVVNGYQEIFAITADI